MMVNIFVYIECMECIIGVAWLDVLEDVAGAVYWNEVGCTVNGIDMNNSRIGKVVVEVTWPNDPHPGVLIRQIIHLLNQQTTA